jgi:membrane fusion protein (multidrug efflux system)
MDYDNAIANSLAASADVQSASAALLKAEVELTYTQINAPVAGMVGKAFFREGSLISPGPDNLLANLYVIDPIWVNFSVSDNDLLKARRELCEKRIIFPPRDQFSIEITLADGSVMPSEGVIDFLSPAIEQTTATMLVRTILRNPKGLLLPGLFVKATVKGAIRPHAILIPQEAVMMGQNGTFVFVISESGTAELRPVETGDWYGDYWIINAGLKAGDIVIGKGVSRVLNHTKVKVETWLPSLPVIEEKKKQLCE